MSAPPGRPAPAAQASPADDGQWTMPAKNYASTRFSALDQINTTNVSRLGLAWTFSTGTTKGLEAPPLVVNNTMYVLTPYPNNLYALDLTRPGAPIKWKYSPNPAPASQGVACCDVVNRGPFFDNGRLFFNTLDDNTVAVDAQTGKEVWRTKVGDIGQGESMTMSPLVAKGKVFVGLSGGELGIRGRLVALDEGSGAIAWTAYSTGPDTAVKIGARFRPFYASMKGKDLGVSSWPGETWKHGGAGVWGWVTYDPATNLVIYGTANPGPWNPDQRPGDNKWSSTLFARDPDTGDAVWAYQISPHDLHDYDGVNENILLDMPFGAQQRQVLVRADRNGYLYIIDRTSGQVLAADPFVPITTSKGVDLRTGALLYDPSRKPIANAVVRMACPASPGGKDWQPMAFSPRTGYLYIPSNNLCQDVQATNANYIPGTPFVGMDVVQYPGPGGNGGQFQLWDVAGRRRVCEIPDRFPVWSGAVVTAGDVAFYGTLEGWFRAVDARNCKILWQFKTASGIVGQPIVYRGPDGKEYVAILSGIGGWVGAIVSGDLDPRDPTAAAGFVNAVQELKKLQTTGGTLYVFALP
ncbi:MAG TPA: PQQ-dependent dehydrogenase, methanol/ethanol family [Longimicrobiales bacterium]